MDFLYGGQEDEPADLNSLPLSHLAEGIGKVYARSSWEDDATWFRFECGDFWNHHQHFETGNFEIYKYEPLATESGEYENYGSNHSVNWLIRTIAHNCILVYDPEEQWKDLRDGGKNVYGNDGGQAKKWDWVVDDLKEWESKKDRFERGKILAYENSPEYLFVAGDCSKAYIQEKLQKWIRQIVFIRPDTFVIFDRVVSTKPEYEKKWVIHGRYEPDIKDRTFTFSQGKGKLAGRILLPEKMQIEKIEGYTYGGKTYDPPKNVLSEVANKWRLEIKPSAFNKEDLFLNILSTSGSGAIKADCVIKNGDIIVNVENNKITFKGDTGGSIEVAGKKTNLAKGIIKEKFE
jgi:hypothetical protein